MENNLTETRSHGRTLSATSATFSVTLKATGEVWKPRELLATAERAEEAKAVRIIDMLGGRLMVKS